MITPEQMAVEYQRVIACAECTRCGDLNVLRDDTFNLPQPGYIGTDYAGTRLLLVGQNPGVSPDRFAQQDQEYAAALCAVRDNPSAATMTALQAVLDGVISTWPVSGNYFPLDHCGLNLTQIAFCNVARCRTPLDSKGNAIRPSAQVVSNCVRLHLRRWLDLLQPAVVICIGKWAHGQIGHLLDTRQVPHTFVNRWRSLSTDSRQRNTEDVARLVRATLGNTQLGGIQS